jgi:hypothetical protein
MVKNNAAYYEIVFTGCGRISDLATRNVLPVAISFQKNLLIVNCFNKYNIFGRIVNYR